jgi:hypothetical protein
MKIISHAQDLTVRGLAAKLDGRITSPAVKRPKIRDHLITMKMAWRRFGTDRVPEWTVFGSIFGGIGAVVAIVALLLTMGGESPQSTKAAPPSPTPGSPSGPSLSPSLWPSSSQSRKGEGYSISVDPNPPSIEDVGASGTLAYVFRPGEKPPTPDSWGSNDFHAPCHEWVLAHGGYDYGQTLIEVVIASQHSQVVVESIEPDVRKPLPPERMEVFRCGGGDIMVGRYLTIDLSTGRTIFRYATLEDPAVKTAPFTGLLVKPGDAEKVQILAQLGDSGGLTQWRLKLNLIVDGARVTGYIDNDGKYFNAVASIL